MLENLSITLNPAESVVYAPMSVTQQVSTSAEQLARDRKFSFNRQGCKVVGIFIGEPESQKYYVRDRVQEAATKIKHIHDVVASCRSCSQSNLFPSFPSLCSSSPGFFASGTSPSNNEGFHDLFR